jgi:hypothetical protein
MLRLKESAGSYYCGPPLKPSPNGSRRTQDDLGLLVRMSELKDLVDTDLQRLGESRRRLLLD